MTMILMMKNNYDGYRCDKLEMGEQGEEGEEEEKELTHEEKQNRSKVAAMPII